MKSFVFVLLFSWCCATCYSGQDNGVVGDDTVRHSIITRNIGSPVIVSEVIISQQLTETTDSRTFPGYILDNRDSRSLPPIPPSMGSTDSLRTVILKALLAKRQREADTRIQILRALLARSEGGRLSLLADRDVSRKREVTRRIVRR